MLISKHSPNSHPTPCFYRNNQGEVKGEGGGEGESEGQGEGEGTGEGG